MINKINIKKNSNLREIVLFPSIKIINPVTLLFGGNDAGKSSIINETLSSVKSKTSDVKVSQTGNTVVLQYINSEQNLRNPTVNPFNGLQEMCSPITWADKISAQEISEGQSIIFSLYPLLDGLEDFTFEAQSGKSYFVVFDEIDSGMSVENVNFICHKIDAIITKRKDVQFLIAFNSYEFVRYFKNVFNIYTGKYQSINSYDEFFNILLDNKKSLYERRCGNEFVGGLPKSKLKSLEEETDIDDNNDFGKHHFSLSRK